VCTIDLSKAFDKINRYAFFIKCMKRNCPIGFIILFDCWFAKTVACVKWGNVLSNFVNLTVGVRQGGVLSPALNAVCVNDVVTLL